MEDKLNQVGDAINKMQKQANQIEQMMNKMAAGNAKSGKNAGEAIGEGFSEGVEESKKVSEQSVFDYIEDVKSTLNNRLKTIEGTCKKLNVDFSKAKIDDKSIAKLQKNIEKQLQGVLNFDLSSAQGKEDFQRVVSNKLQSEVGGNLLNQLKEYGKLATTPGQVQELNDITKRLMFDVANANKHLSRVKTNDGSAIPLTNDVTRQSAKAYSDALEAQKTAFDNGKKSAQEYLTCEQKFIPLATQTAEASKTSAEAKQSETQASEANTKALNKEAEAEDNLRRKKRQTVNTDTKSPIATTYTDAKGKTSTEAYDAKGNEKKTTTVNYDETYNKRLAAATAVLKKEEEIKIVQAKNGDNSAELTAKQRTLATLKAEQTAIDTEIKSTIELKQYDLQTKDIEAELLKIRQKSAETLAKTSTQASKQNDTKQASSAKKLYDDQASALKKVLSTQSELNVAQIKNKGVDNEEIAALRNKLQLKQQDYNLAKSRAKAELNINEYLQQQAKLNWVRTDTRVNLASAEGKAIDSASKASGLSASSNYNKLYKEQEDILARIYKIKTSINTLNHTEGNMTEPLAEAETQLQFQQDLLAAKKQSVQTQIDSVKYEQMQFELKQKQSELQDKLSLAIKTSDAKANTAINKRNKKEAEQLSTDTEKVNASTYNTSYTLASKQLEKYESILNKSKVASDELKQKFISLQDAFNNVSTVDGLNNWKTQFSAIKKNIDDITEKAKQLQLIAQTKTDLQNLTQSRGVNLDTQGQVYTGAISQIEALDNKLKTSKISVNEYKNSISDIFKQLRAQKGVEIGIFPDFKTGQEQAMQFASTYDGVMKSTIRTSRDAAGNFKVMFDALDKNTKQVKTIQASYNSLTNSLTALEVKTKTSVGGMTEFVDGLKKKWSEVARYLLSFASVWQAWAVFKEGINTVRELDTALTEMRKVSNESLSTLKSFQAESYNLADSVGTTGKQIQQSTADFMRLGESLTDAKESAKDASLLMNVSEFDNIDDATTSLIAMSSAYKDLSKMDIIDKLNNIGKQIMPKRMVTYGVL